MDIPTVGELSTVIERMMDEPYAGLVNGILFGTKQTLPYWLKDDLISTGTIHIAALSGMNISIVLTLVSKLLSRMVGRRISAGISILAITGFVLWIGPSPSIVRAAIMGSLALLATLFGRQNWGALSWFVACGVMVIWSPSIVSDISFQLSALATLGLVVAGEQKTDMFQTKRNPVGISQNQLGTRGMQVPEIFHSNTRRFMEYFRPFFEAVYADFRTTLAAQMFTLPVLIFTFRRISLIAPVANVLIGWTIAPITIVGWIGAITGYVFLPLGMPFALVARYLSQYLIWVVGVLGGVGNIRI